MLQTLLSTYYIGFCAVVMGLMATSLLAPWSSVTISKGDESWKILSFPTTCSITHLSSPHDVSLQTNVRMSVNEMPSGAIKSCMMCYLFFVSMTLFSCCVVIVVSAAQTIPKARLTHMDNALRLSSLVVAVMVIGCWITGTVAVVDHGGYHSLLEHSGVVLDSQMEGDNVKTTVQARSSYFNNLAAVGFSLICVMFSPYMRSTL